MTKKTFNCNSLHTSYYDVIGRRFNGHDLHHYLREKGMPSRQIVWHKQSHDNHTKAYQRSGRDGIQQVCSNIEEVYGLQSHFYPFSCQLLFDPWFIEADIVHYHIIHDHFFNISHLPILTKLKPSVWTIHDPWALTGHCIHPYDCVRWKTGCGDCPSLNSWFPLEQDTTAINWEIKKQIFSMCDFDIIVSSSWMKKRVESSPFFDGFHIHCVPFGLDLERFKPTNMTSARKRFNIPMDDLVLCFRSTDSEFKGLHTIINALESLEFSQPVTLLTFDRAGLLDRFKNRFRVIDLGWVHDDLMLIDMYSASDIFLMPSIGESFGMTALEAMACETPCIVMAGTALEELVSEECGIVVSKGNNGGFTRALKDLAGNKDRRKEMGIKARGIAQSSYNKDHYVSQIIDIYKDVSQRRSFGSRNIYLLEQLKRCQPDYAREIIPEMPWLYKKLRENKWFSRLWRNLINPLFQKIRLRK